MAASSPMNNPAMNQGPLATRQRVAYGSKGSKRIGGMGQAIDGVGTGIGVRGYQPGVKAGGAGGMFRSAAEQRQDNVNLAKQDGTFDGKRDAFNAANKTQEMDENGLITNRKVTEVDPLKGIDTSPRPAGPQIGVAASAEDTVRRTLGLTEERPDLPTLEPRAKGGPVKGGRPYLVGERGPEVIVPKRDGVVIPNEVIDPKGGSGKKSGKALNDRAAWFVREAKRHLGQKG